MTTAFFFILGASLLGFFVAVFLRHIRMTVHGKSHTTCPSYYDCQLVVSSKYTNVFGIPLELFTGIYFGLMFLYYLSSLIFPFFVSDFVTFVVVGISIVVFFLIGQIMTMHIMEFKKMCTWCFLLIICCAVIAMGSLSVANTSIVTLLADYKFFVVALHLLGFALGVGGATITDTFFFKFLKDYHISKWEAKILHQVSQVIWVGLGILILSGIGLYLPNMEALNMSTKFISKVIIVAIILLNGILLNMYISPKMINISFRKKHKHHPGELLRLRRAAFASGAVSIVSWYSAFLLGMLKSVPLSVAQILFIYFCCLVLAVLVSQGVERYFEMRARVK